MKTRTLMILLTIGGMLTAAGCGKDKQVAAPIIDTPVERDAAAQYTESINAGEAPKLIKEPDTGADDKDEAYTVDAMVGQINGKPVYASSIFKELGEESLINRGQSRTRDQFTREVGQDLVNIVNARVTNNLILAEAEAELTPQMQFGLFQALKKEREKFVAQFLGSDALAEEELRKQGYEDLEEYVEERRQEILLDHYRRQKVFPKIFVTRRQIERYYGQNLGEYQKPGKMSVRIIRVTTSAKAEAVEKALGAGEDYKAVAEQHTETRRSNGGLWDFVARLETFDALPDDVDEHVRALTLGQHSERIDREDGSAWWVKLEAYEPGENISLTDAYLSIEIILRRRQAEKLQYEQIAELRRGGNYTPVPQMVEALLEIAINRYANAK